MKKFLKGFLYASRGIATASNERNMRFHLATTWFVIFFGVFFRVSRTEWIMLFFAIGMVLSAEAFNTAFEYLVNLIRDDCHVPYANKKLGLAKDIAAGAVLIVAVMAGIVGVIVFSPHIIPLI